MISLFGSEKSETLCFIIWFYRSHFAHPDRSLWERKKASVLHLMEGSISSSIPGEVNVAIADGMFVIQNFVKDKTPTFTAFARSVLFRVLKLTKTPSWFMFWFDSRFDLQPYCFHIFYFLWCKPSLIRKHSLLLLKKTAPSVIFFSISATSLSTAAFDIWFAFLFLHQNYRWRLY